MGFHDGFEAGEQIDFYRIEAPVARSGMASIYRAIDTRDNRVVALKIPHPDLEADPILFDRFVREGGIGEKLDHPKVMRVFGGEERSRVYMVMEWCEGRLLRKIDVYKRQMNISSPPTRPELRSATRAACLSPCSTRLVSRCPLLSLIRPRTPAETSSPTKARLR